MACRLVHPHQPLVGQLLVGHLLTSLIQGPDVHGIGSAIPENCHVDQAAYVLRHGSRYPDAGAYQGWVDMALRVRTTNHA